MVILILSEPRSGSTNFASWFSLQKSFTVLQEPLNKNGIHFKKGEPIDKWEYNTDHLLIKEIYTPTSNLKELINRADKIILLHRKNIEDQIESWLVATETDQWASEWASGYTRITDKDNKINYFKSLKNGFRDEYLNKPEFFSISYEELYNDNGIEKVITYLDTDSIENKNFPFGKKYKITPGKPIKLI